MIVEESKRPDMETVYEGLINKKADKWLIPLLYIIVGIGFLLSILLEMMRKV
jgi:hypothetical protein